MLIPKDITIANMSIETLKNYLKVDYDDDDQIIGIFWHSALGYIKSKVHVDLEDELTVLELPYEFIMAALMLTEYFYDKRTVVNVPKNLELSVDSLLKPHFSYGDHWDELV